MIQVTATEFAKNFGRYKEAAQREPVAITSHGRASGYFVAAHEYAELQRLRALERRGGYAGDVPADSPADPAHAKRRASATSSGSD